MSELATVGIDLAKSIFQIHGVDESGRVLVRRQLRRTQSGTSKNRFLIDMLRRTFGV